MLERIIEISVRNKYLVVVFGLLISLAGAWAIGVLVGLDLLLTGFAMIILARAVSKVSASGYVETIRL